MLSQAQGSCRWPAVTAVPSALADALWRYRPAPKHVQEAGIDPSSPRDAWPEGKLVRVLQAMQQTGKCSRMLCRHQPAARCAVAAPSGLESSPWLNSLSPALSASLSVRS